MASRILVVAGESSGDLHGAGLVRALQERDPHIQVFTLGGPRMAATGARVLFPLAEHGVVGFAEVLAHAPSIFKAKALAKRFLREQRPDAVVLIDYPGFNLALARKARECGIPVVYYISPQVWAWHGSRIRTIRERVDQMLVILPMEVPLFEEAGVPVEFVGHPLLDIMPDPAGSEPFDPDQPFDVGLLPGSRPAELRKHLPLVIRAAARIAESFPNARFLIPVAEGVKACQIMDILEKAEGVRLDAAYVSEDLELLLQTRPLAVGIATGTHEVCLVRDPNYTYRSKMAFAVTKSGTSTLENAILGVPMIVFYKTTFFTYILAKHLIQIEFIGLVNVVAGRRIVPELIQKEANPSRIALETIRILQNESLYRKMKSDLAEVRSRLGDKGASRRAAEAVLDIAKGNKGTAVS